MRFQHFLLAMPLAFGLFACGSDDSSSAAPSDDPVDLSSQSVVPPNSDNPGLSSASEGGNQNPNPDNNSSASGGNTNPSAVALAPTANMASATALLSAMASSRIAKSGSIPYLW